MPSDRNAQRSPTAAAKLGQPQRQYGTAPAKSGQLEQQQQLRGPQPQDLLRQYASAAAPSQMPQQQHSKAMVHTQQQSSTNQLQPQQQQQRLTPASREALATAEAGLRAMVAEVDPADVSWYYVDPKVLRSFSLRSIWLLCKLSREIYQGCLRA